MKWLCSCFTCSLITWPTNCILWIGSLRNGTVLNQIIIILPWLVGWGKKCVTKKKLWHLGVILFEKMTKRKSNVPDMSYCRQIMWIAPLLAEGDLSNFQSQVDWLHYYRLPLLQYYRTGNSSYPEKQELVVEPDTPSACHSCNRLYLETIFFKNGLTQPFFRTIDCNEIKQRNTILAAICEKSVWGLF